MKVCYFGSYPLYYPRHRIIIKGLKKNGIDVIEVQDSSRIYLRYPKLIKKYIETDNYDIMIVGEASNYVMPLAVLLKKLSKKPLVFDTFVSLYDTNKDRGLHQNTIASKFYFYFDKYNFEFSDIVLSGTYQELIYYHNTFRVEREKFRRVFIGAEDNIFYPREKEEVNKDIFRVLFYGTYIPLHGIEYIVKAAKLLESHKDIKFQIIGTGQTLGDIERLSNRLKISNIEFIKRLVRYEDLPKYISNSDVGLGIFGGTEKAKRVIPTKAYQIIAMKKPLITGDSPAARELFSHKNNAILCKMADPRALADSILMLKEDERLRQKIAENGYKLFKEKLTPEVIGLQVKNILEELV